MINQLLGKISHYIINPIILLAFTVALLLFFWGIFQFISSEAADSGKRAEGQRRIAYGLLGMFVMIGAYGLIRFVLGIFDLTPSGYPFN